MLDRMQLEPAHLFYSYASEDEALREILEKHLKLLERQGLLASWHHRLIQAGEDRKRAIDEHLETASIILLLISPDFLASDYCYEIEMQHALERQRAGKARVIPLILRPCDWQTASFGYLQALPHNGQAITTWINQDEAFLQISRSLRALLTQPVFVGRSSRRDAQNWANMLIKLQRMYDEVLDDSLQRLAWIDLPLKSVPSAVHTTANLLLHRTNLPPQALEPSTSIQEVYQQANQKLLILGEPGAGKSTLLYQLGRNLLPQTQQPAQPLPVVFPLASWAQKRLSLQEWMVEQLCSSLYEVPRRQSQQWVQNQQILPLFDGLDEMEETARPACIVAINAYHSTFPMCPLVVCSRSQEYHETAQQERLHLYNAVEVQPLTVEQQEEAIQQAGTTVEELQTELTINEEELHELVRTPLWLNILLVTVRDTPLPIHPQGGPVLRQQVLRRYVQRMCERKGDADRYSLKQTEHWLGFLANQMRRRNQMGFAIEILQPDWLTGLFRKAYFWSIGLVAGPALGLVVFGLPIALLSGPFSRLLPNLVTNPVTGLVTNPVTNPALGVLFGPVLGVLCGLVIGLSYTLFFGLVNELESKVTFAERLIWSREQIGSNLLVGLLSGLAAGLLFGLVAGLLSGLLIGLLFRLLVGLRKEQLVKRDTSFPGEGINRSVKNGLLVSSVFGLVAGLLSGLLFGLVAGLLSGLLIGLVAGLLVGFIPILQYLMLRFWLACAGCLPWSAFAFLDDACERSLLKRVGGTYRFIHRLVLDYFADLSHEPMLPEKNS